MSDSATTTTRPCEHGEPRGCAACPLCRQDGCELCHRGTRVLSGPERVFTLRLPTDLHEALRQRAKAEDRRLAQTVRAALRAYLGS